MSYCRFGEGDVYIFSTGEYLICQSCPMRGYTFTTTSRVEMLAHVIAHRIHGELVPRRVDERLMKEIDTEGDEVGDGLRSEDPPTDEGAGAADPAGPDEGTTA